MNARKIVTAVGIVATVATLSACKPGYITPPDAPAGCMFADFAENMYETDPEWRADWDLHILGGWQGWKHDSAERIYSPECFLTAEDGSKVLWTFYA